MKFVSQPKVAQRLLGWVELIKFAFLLKVLLNGMSRLFEFKEKSELSSFCLLRFGVTL